MTIIRAEKMGFCFGVTKAVDMANALVKTQPNTPIFILGMLVHNQQVINTLMEKGIHFINDTDIDSLNENSIVIIRAHGITKELYAYLESKNLEIHDATCIFVKKARDLIIEKSREGFHILFIGDSDHPEVQGIVSHVKNVTLFPNLQELIQSGIDRDKKYFVMCQTTFNQPKFHEIRNYCEENFSNTTVSDTICYATHERQLAVGNLARTCDKIIVVGGKNSSNTMKLFSLAKVINPNSFHVETAKELDLNQFFKTDIIGITAGASTPEQSIIEIEQKLKEAFLEKQELDFEALLNEYAPTLEKGKIVKGLLIHKDNTQALVEMTGIKGQGKLRAEEVVNFEVGDEIDVQIMTTNEDSNGNIIVSHEVVVKQQAYKEIEIAKENNTVLTGKIQEATNGGYRVAFKFFTFFLPRSLAPANPKVGSTVQFIIKEIKPKNNIVISYRDWHNAVISKEFSELSLNSIISGTVENVIDSGVIISFGNLNGFLHLSEISWDPVSDAHNYFKKGQKVNAKIISLDAQKNNIKLSTKQLESDPWILFEKEQKEGDIISGQVLEIKPFGAIVALTTGIRGFLHKSEVAWDRYIKNVKDYIQEGDSISVQIIELDSKKRSVKLSLKAVKDNPWETIDSTYPLKSQVSGKITHIYDYGVFVQVANGLEFFIYKNDLAWINPSVDNFKLGEVISFQVIEINTEKKQLKGSVKALLDNPYKTFASKHKLYSSITAPIHAILDRGLQIKLTDCILGFVPNSEIELNETIENLNKRFTVGDSITAQIIDLDVKKQRVILSIAKYAAHAERQELDDLLKQYGV